MNQPLVKFLKRKQWKYRIALIFLAYHLTLVVGVYSEVNLDFLFYLGLPILLPYFIWEMVSQLSYREFIRFTELFPHDLTLVRHGLNLGFVIVSGLLWTAQGFILGWIIDSFIGRSKRKH